MTSELTEKTLKAITQPIKDGVVSESEAKQQATEKPIVDVLAERAIVALAELLKK